MWDYLKFWMAKELVPFIIIAAIFAIFFFLYGLAIVADAVNRWRRRRIPREMLISAGPDTGLDKLPSPVTLTLASESVAGQRIVAINTSDAVAQIDGFGPIKPGEVRAFKSVGGRWKRQRVRELVERWRRKR